MRLRQTLASLIFALTLPARAQTPAPAGPYLFTYFKEPATQGIYLALSRDGYTFTPLNDGQPWLAPSQPGEIMRDIFITRTPDNHFRAVWTWAWHGNAIGTADSPDLIHWSPQRRVDIMSAFPTVQNTWAPETYWDAATHDWLLIWSSSFSAAPSAPALGAPSVPTASSSERVGPAPAIPTGLRIWSAHTKDWQTFSTPTLFFDRGFPAIDATMFHRTLHGKKDVVLVVKDQTPDPLRYNERWTSAPTVNGPWNLPSGSALSAPINEPWSEGPSVLQVGDHAVVFYDHYRPPNPRFEAVETTDWIHWTSANSKIHLPEASKHGSFLPITEAEAATLLTRHDPISTPNP